MFAGNNRKTIALWMGTAVLAGAGLILLLRGAKRWSFAEFDRSNRQTISPPSRLRPVLNNDVDKVAGEIVYLNNVTLKPGPAPNVFYAVGLRARACWWWRPVFRLP